MKKKFKKTLRSNTHPIKPKMVITSKKDKLNTRRAKKINLRKMIDTLKKNLRKMIEFCSILKNLN